MSKDLELTVQGWVAATPYISSKDDGVVSFVSFPIMHTQRYRDTAGEWKYGNSVTLRAKAWGIMANNIARSIDKGHPVVASGRLGVEYWEDDEGHKRQENVLRLTAIGHDLSYGTTGFTRVRRNEKSGDEKFSNEKHESSIDCFNDPNAVDYVIVDQAEVVNTPS